MRIKDVVTLKEVVNDLNDGKAFYDQRETGVGDYFWDSLIADIESLTRLSHFEKNIPIFNRLWLQALQTSFKFCLGQVFLYW